jgi:hypothetical protein
MKKLAYILEDPAVVVAFDYPEEELDYPKEGVDFPAAVLNYPLVWQ